MTTDELTELLFDKFNIKVNATSLHPLDEDFIKGTLKEFINRGFDVNPDLFSKLAVQHNWNERARQFLIEKSQHLLAGGNVQLKHNKESGKFMFQKIIEDYPEEFQDFGE